jgi:hypothetical protein
MDRACSTNGGEEERVWIIMGKPEGKRPLGRPRRRHEMHRACSTSGREEERVWVIVGILEGNRPLGRPRYRWVDKIKMAPGEIG